MSEGSFEILTNQDDFLLDPYNSLRWLNCTASVMDEYIYRDPDLNDERIARERESYFTRLEITYLMRSKKIKKRMGNRKTKDIEIFCSNFMKGFKMNPNAELIINKKVSLPIAKNKCFGFIDVAIVDNSNNSIILAKYPSIKYLDNTNYSMAAKYEMLTLAALLLTDDIYENIKTVTVVDDFDELKDEKGIAFIGSEVNRNDLNKLIDEICNILAVVLVGSSKDKPIYHPKTEICQLCVVDKRFCSEFLSTEET